MLSSRSIAVLHIGHGRDAAMNVRVALSAHRQVVARHVQHAALLVHAHDAEVAVVGGVDAGLLGLVGGFFEVFGELLLDL